jgi:hypothetical protein
MRSFCRFWKSCSAKVRDFFDRRNFAPSWCDESASSSDSRSCERRLSEKLNKLHDRYLKANLFVVSFPKSGRTWVRAVIANYLQLRYGTAVDLEFSADSKFFRRPCFTHNFFDVYRYVQQPVELLEKSFFEDKPLVLIVRDPRDVCASYFHHIGSRDGMWTGGPLRFALDPVYGIWRQVRFVNMILDLHEAHRGPKVVLSYESLRENPLRGFATLLSLIDYNEVDQAVLAEAIGNTSFEKMRETEILASKSGVIANGARLGVKDWTGNVNALKVRRGVVGGFWQDFGVPSGLLLSMFPSVLGLLLRLRRLTKGDVLPPAVADCANPASEGIQHR